MERRRKNISAKTRWEVFRRDNFKCVYCGAGQEARLVIDDESNYVTACASCNAGKRDSVVLPEAAHEAVPAEQIVVGGLLFDGQLHADWWVALCRNFPKVQYKPAPVCVRVCSFDDTDDGNRTVFADFACWPRIDGAGKPTYVFVVQACDIGTMGLQAKTKMRDGAILGYSTPTWLIIGSPWFFRGVEINDRHKGCPAGHAINGHLESAGEIYLAGWYPDEGEDVADFRKYEDVCPACVEARGWLPTISQVIDSCMEDGNGL